MDRNQAFNLSGEIALITGGGTGLGLAIAGALAACGARVVICGRREPELKAAAARLGPSVSWRVHDVTDLEANEGLIANIEETEGPLGILINNAGRHLKKPAEDVSDEEFQNVLDVHLKASFSLSRAAARRMIPRGRGSVVFVASMASVFGIPGVVAYTAAKSALAGMTRALAVEWSPHGLRVNAIAPGWIESAMMRGAMHSDPAREQKILSRTPMARFGQPEDIGWAAAYLCSPAARFVTGTCLVVDGGISIGF